MRSARGASSPTWNTSAPGEFLAPRRAASGSNASGNQLPKNSAGLVGTGDMSDSAADELADSMGFARAEQPELHAEARFVGPANDSWQLQCAFGSRQRNLDGKLGPEGNRLRRFEVHAADADVFGTSLEAGAVLAMASNDGCDARSRMTALFDHDLVRTLRLRSWQRPSLIGLAVRNRAVGAEVRHGTRL